MLRPRVKANHDPVRFTDGRIRIGTVQYGVGSEIVDPDGAVWSLLHLLDGTRDVDGVVSSLAEQRPELDRTSVRDSIDTLVAAGFCEDAGAPVPAALTPAEVERYAASTRYFSWIDTDPRRSRYDVQVALKRARVTVLGVGGTGGAVAMGLVAAGVGRVHCLDFDDVEVSNLNRQVLYGEGDVGRPKVATAVRRLSQQNANVQVTGTELRVTGPEDLEAAMRASDFFVLCADQPNPGIQLWTSEAALRTGTPWSLCAYAGPMAVTGIFVPFETACYECFEATHRDSRLGPDGRAPEPLLEVPGGNAVIAPTANITGQLGALEAIYFLGGLKPQTVGRVFHQNLMVYDHSYYIEPLRRSDCPMCGDRVAGEARTVRDDVVAPR